MDSCSAHVMAELNGEVARTEPLCSCLPCVDSFMTENAVRLALCVPHCAKQACVYIFVYLPSVLTVQGKGHGRAGQRQVAAGPSDDVAAPPALPSPLCDWQLGVHAAVPAVQPDKQHLPLLCADALQHGGGTNPRHYLIACGVSGWVGG
jgi:hypothetical protein